MPLVEHPCPFCDGQPMSPDCGMCGGAGTLPDVTPVVRAAQKTRVDEPPTELTTRAGRLLLALLFSADVRWPDEHTRISVRVWADKLADIENEARASLAPYARHKKDCSIYMPTDGPCTCGLLAALAGQEADRG